MDRTPPTPCIFCSPDPARVFLDLGDVYALWDGFPVSPGHALIIPKRHVATWFEASAIERAAIVAAIEPVCEIVRARFGADGFNFGVNVGAAAGQTVPHLHFHVIPRRAGDVPDPRGGVRHIIPSKGNYLKDVVGGAGEGAIGDRAGSPGLPGLPPVSMGTRAASPLTTGPHNPLLPRLEQDIAGASRVDIAVAFIQPSGIERLYPHFDELLERGGSLRVLVGDYLDITDPDALQRLLDLAALHGAARVAVRIYVTRGRSFHPKAYLVASEAGLRVAWIGSSNLSESALREGVEWNYRIDSLTDHAALATATIEFEKLFADPRTRILDSAWLADYRARRVVPRLPVTLDDVEAVEPPQPPPEPNIVQREALAALEATRAGGATAGLVVMATGVGKTWLAAFDTARPGFARILFVAHREEILVQALATFRRVRPTASLGLYTGQERAADAGILFASVQTLGRSEHLARFAPEAFDYLVVDEFHHAAAASYRRLIDHFRPAFLLGLTATPERADGGDLMSLCGGNLVYRCDVPRGIELGLLCPFRYFGVPDEVDYRNIPWRSSRFDEETLVRELATQRRADNALDHWRRLGGERTIAFCASQRHTEFMKRHFADAGIPCAAVHSGPGSDGRAWSIERLAEGAIRVLFAVDMFNEGVDVPAIDTVLMLRPTESVVVWMQQFGRGLRRQGEKRLTVIDYIGNHRVFLTKARALLGQRDGAAQLRMALEQVWRGEYALPPGCEVTYDPAAIDILKALLPRGQHDALAEYYRDFRERRGSRPTASEAWSDGYNPRSARRSHGSWLGFVAEMGDLDAPARELLQTHGRLLRGLETTAMSKSYKMVLLKALQALGGLPGHGVPIERLAREFAHIARRHPALIRDVGELLEDEASLVAMLERNPVAALAGTGAFGSPPLFAYQDRVFSYRIAATREDTEMLGTLARELIDWRLDEYLARGSAEFEAAGSFEMKVSHTNGKPILFLPNRELHPGIPSGWQDIEFLGERLLANFVKVAVNVVRRPGSTTNVLPELLRRAFGDAAGQPGTRHVVRCEWVGNRSLWLAD